MAACRLVFLLIQVALAGVAGAVWAQSPVPLDRVLVVINDEAVTQWEGRG